MGTWISHLRIAENLLETLTFDPAAFACGHLAPDSGLPNADWSAFDPPKETTHYLQKGEGEGDIRDLDFYRDYVDELSDGENLEERYSFLWGYFFHLLCDNLWSKRISATSQRQFATLFSEQREQGKDAFWVLKEDWYGLDFRFLKDHPESLFWRVFLPSPNPPSYVASIPEATLHDQLDYKRSFYANPEAGMVFERPYPYLNDKTMTRFVDDCTSSLLEIYAALQDDVDLKNSTTALDIVAKTQLAPYSFPLGDKPV